MAHILFREAFNPIHIQDKKQIMYEIEMSISQLIIVGFEKLKRQNVHQHLLYTLRGGEGVTKKCAFCTLSINVDNFGWPLSWKFYETSLDTTSRTLAIDNMSKMCCTSLI